MKAIYVLLAVLCLSLSASAEETIGPNDVAEAVAAEVKAAPVAVVAPVETNLAEGVIVLSKPFWWDGLVDSLAGLIGIGWKAIFIYGVGWIIGKLASKERAEEVMDALNVGVSNSWEDMGRALKHAAADRKLTADERQKLQNKAYEHAKSILTVTGKKLLEGYSWSKVVDMISAAVQKRKAIASVAKGKASAVSSPAA